MSERYSSSTERGVTAMRVGIFEIAERVRTFFTAPVLPATALALRQREIALVEARRRRGRLLVRRAAVEPVPEGALEPTFDGKNVRAKESLRRALQRAVERAGLQHARRWAVALPSAACRVFLLEIEHAPKAKEELASVIGWKIERLVGISAAELTIAVQHLPHRRGRSVMGAAPSAREAASRSERFLAVAARSEVLAAYEEVLKEAGLHPGFLIPNNLAESGWMATLPSGHDALLISVEGEWLTLFFTRDREPLAIRAVHCEPEAVLEEIHRTLVYYQDRLSHHVRGSLSAEDAAAQAETALVVSKEEAAGHPPAPLGGGLHTIVVVNHNEGAEEARSPFAREIETLCHALFPSGAVPALYSLNEHALEPSASWRLSHLAAPLGVIACS